MKPFILKTGITFLLMSIIGTGCEKDLPPYQAKGIIIAVTSQCYGEVVVIEVENPKRVGLAGTFSTIGKEIDIRFDNAIGVPYFSKIGIPDIVPQTIGTWIYFEYRELIEEERGQSSLWETDPPIVCQTIYGTPSAKRLIITKIFSYK